MKKRLALIVLLICTLVLTACSGTKDLTKGKTAEQIVEESFAKWYKLSNYNLDLNSKIKIATGDTDMDIGMQGKMTVFQNPLKIKMIIDAKIPGFDEKMQMEQYMIQEDEQRVAIYQHMNDQWQKMTIDDPQFTRMMNMDPRDNLKLFIDNLKKAEILGEEKIGEKNTVKIDLVASGEIFTELLKNTAGNNLGFSADMFNPELLTKIGDIKYLIWVDKATLDTVKCQLDMTENMKNLGNALAEDQNIPAEVKDAFQNMEIVMEYTVKNQDKAQDFSIPEEAKNAREIPFGSK